MSPKRKLIGLNPINNKIIKKRINPNTFFSIKFTGDSNVMLQLLMKTKSVITSKKL